MRRPSYAREPNAVLMQLLAAYDRYIQNANDEDRFESGWRPVCIEEFYHSEFQEVVAREPAPKRMRRFFLGHALDERTDQVKVVRATPQGWDATTGLRMDRWAEVVATSMAEAREKFARGECSWLS